MPLYGITFPRTESLIKKEYDTVVTHSNIQVTKVSWKPSVDKTHLMKLHSNMSFALFISDLTAM